MLLKPVILSGGSGSRLWPLSREKNPKQLLKLFNDKTLLQNTMGRISGLEQYFTQISTPLIVGNVDYRFIVENQLKSIQSIAHCILEPVSRNTAPALTVAAFKSIENGLDPVMLVMPADHAISNIHAFEQAVQVAAKKADEGAVVCFGITPHAPDIGFGYIKTQKNEQTGIHQLEKFVEKPSLEIAKQYVDSGEYYWNSGLFVLKASVWLSLIKQANLEIYTACEEAFQLSSKVDAFTILDKPSFEKSHDDSIDYAVMEKLGQGEFSHVPSYVVPFDVDWSDVGGWAAVWEISQKNEQGNVLKGVDPNLVHASQNNLVYSSNKRVVSLLGAENLIVVDTDDALFIADRKNLNEMRALVKKIKDHYPELMENGRKVDRPWGTYDSIDKEQNFQVKRIVVNPGEKLSLQMHYHRAEHWIVVRGTGRVTCGENVFLLTENESTYIPMGEVHRLENPGKVPLEIIEVQSGHYLGEDDIVRLEDNYGRCG
ncbi:MULTISPECIES: mannose-1-phosphate guanylyltransferase/mannose-6-phosphate isomerase [Acinetobacter]|uniref:mannose-1-phosphate guanylyltransferase n=1 Tax=Acinetobacter chengduensis TaxID=2420890 RepID=A0ABX9TXH0_9GAMM|nr:MULTISPECIES: mannose-1-phosphate guanylyltransferase/mannose-6-phosphate isomerase [Acinetobacter]MBI1450692.1 mannose-1-phosphate guanylyltransferase/mannose-6-phosphate isomerase [Acinetobacter sp. FL51]RKG40776.1 mannose-1-phosphate guanylyltransferase/mannose-6-phosphate isomerase [Acinetobacter sp. WCHAc060007]RLL22844.1 mannose-1-phosphate guanylyltransferase/mannose-6-phosphate isomerase [Acinetobacter chengduensis]